MKFLSVVFLAMLLITAPAWAQVSPKESEQLDFAQGLLSRGMYDMAILQYQKFITNYPKSASLPVAYLCLAEGYFLSQDFDKAFDTFNQFRQLFPNSDQLPISVLRLGQIDIEKKKYDEALKELTSVDVDKKLTGQMQQSFDFYIAQSYLNLGNSAQALVFFQKASEVAGVSSFTGDALKEIGILEVENGHYPEAIDAYTKALQAAQDDTLKEEMTYRIAEVKFLSGQYQDAIDGFNQVLKQFPSGSLSQDALSNLLLAYFNLGEYDQLLKEYQQDAKQIKNDSSYFTVHMAAVMANIEKEKYPEANALLDRMLAFSNLKSQQTAKIFIKKAEILIKQKNFKDAMALLSAYSAEDIDDADETLFLKGQTYFGLGNYDQAFNCFESVAVRFPDSRFAKAALLGEAHARKETGRFKESEELFSRYVQTQDKPDLKSEALYDSVMMALKAEETSTVIAKAQEYLKTFPNGAEYSMILLLLADSYGDNNQPQDAINLLQGYLASPQGSLRPNAANFLLGYNEEVLGHTAEALAAYGKVDANKEGGKFYVAAVKNMAIIDLSLKNYDQARIYFDQLIAHPDESDLQIKTYIWVCNEYLKLQRYEDVMRVANLAEKRFSSGDLLEIRYYKAEASRAIDNCSEAIKDYNQIISSSQKNAFTGSAHIGYGLCLVEAKQFDAAASQYQAALDENEDDYTIAMHAQFEMANLKVAQGDLDDAVKYYILIATIYDDEHYCSESLLRAAKIFEQQKKNEDAIKMYSEILDKYKDTDAFSVAQERMKHLK